MDVEKATPPEHPLATTHYPYHTAARCERLPESTLKNLKGTFFITLPVLPDQSTAVARCRQPRLPSRIGSPLFSFWTFCYQHICGIFLSATTSTPIHTFVHLLRLGLNLPFRIEQSVNGFPAFCRSRTGLPIRSTRGPRGGSCPFASDDSFLRYPRNIAFRSQYCLLTYYSSIRYRSNRS